MEDYNSTSVAGGGGGDSADGDNGGSYVPTPSFSQPSLHNLPDFTYDLNGVNPNTDLQFNAFNRGYGLDRSNALAQSAYTRASLNAQLQAALPAFDTQRQEGTTDVAENMAQRGGFRSSARLLGQDKVVRSVDSQEAAFKAGIADKQAQAAFGLQDTLNGLDQNNAEQQMAARQRLVDQQNQTIAYQRALQQLGLS